MTGNHRRLFAWLAWIALMPASMASAQEQDECVLRGILSAEKDTPIAQIRAGCTSALEASAGKAGTQWMDCLRLRAVSADDTATTDKIKAECRELMNSGVKLPDRIVESRTTESNPYVITPLRQNYILPYTYNRYSEHLPLATQEDESLDNEEAKLQISLMVPLTYTDLLFPNDGIYFGFTLKSFWQVYNKDISAPFRETNYRPEFFYQMPLPIASSRGVWLGRLGIEHESNGRTQYLSRSWNRVYFTVGYMRPEWSLVIQPWYRLPEDRKEDDGDPSTPPPADGDDNPDIEDYMGQYELTGAYRWENFEFSGLFRRNFDEGRGAHEISMSFPLWGRMRGFAQYFEGYGESLIDYNHKVQRFGVGVLLTDLM